MELEFAIFWKLGARLSYTLDLFTLDLFTPSPLTDFCLNFSGVFAYLLLLYLEVCFPNTYGALPRAPKYKCLLGVHFQIAS